MTSREAINGKTRSLPDCNNCADTIDTGRVELILKVKTGNGNASLSCRRRVFRKIEGIRRVWRYTSELLFL